jgi:hypothetical protein
MRSHANGNSTPINKGKFTLTLALSLRRARYYKNRGAGEMLLLGDWGCPPILFYFPQEWGITGG